MAGVSGPWTGATVQLMSFGVLVAYVYSGAILLFHRVRECVRASYYGGALQGLLVRWCNHLGNQRRGYARPVGVPGEFTVLMDMSGPRLSLWNREEQWHAEGREKHWSLNQTWKHQGK